MITPSDQRYLKKFIDTFGPFPFPIYGDPDRALYRIMGHKTMNKWKLLAKAGQSFLKGGRKAFLPDDPKQRNLVKDSLKNQDVYIQGGTWIFNRDGQMVWSHIDESPEDHATIDDLLVRAKQI